MFLCKNYDLTKRIGMKLGINWEKWIYSLEDNFGIIKNNGTEHEMNQYTNSELEKVR